MLAPIAVLAVMAACRAEEQPGFDIVRVPQTAYLTPDAAVAPDAGAPEAGTREGGAFRPSIPPLCFVPPPRAPSEDESVGEPYPECAQYRNGSQYFDKDRTDRAREKAKKPLCCYQISHDEE
jgi:hypothetical protein